MSYLFSQNERSIRVFISSTFQDMMSEREVLIKRVFPRLRDYCSQRQVQITEIDLRWGITDEEAQQGKVIAACLNEVDKSRPYFIGILGDRYGWCPTAEDLAKRQSILEDFPWLAQDIAAGLSITDIEMQYGVLRGQGAQNAFFYLKSIPPRTPEAGNQADQKLWALRQALLAQQQYPVKQYENFSQLEQQVLDDLTALIDRHFPLPETPDALALERLQHILAAQKKLWFYIPDEAAFAQLDEYAAQGGKPLVLYGEAGSGKTALLANWLQSYNQRDPERFLFFHLLPQEDCRSILTRLLLEIKAAFGLADEVPAEETALVEALPLFLAQTGTRGSWVLALDAVEKIRREGGLEGLSWLPESFPPFVRVVLATASRATAEALATRGYTPVELAQPQPDILRQLIEGYLGKYGKKLSPALSEQMLQTPWAQTPAILRAILDELRMFGLHEGLAAQLEAYLNAGSPQAFYRYVLLRLEHDCEENCPGLTRKVLGYIWASKNGMTEQEILQLLGLPRLYVSPLFHCLSQHLESAGGVLRFSSDTLREAVRAKYLPSRAKIAAVRRELAAYFSQNPLDSRSMAELPYQLAQLNHWQSLKRYLQNPQVFLKLHAANPYELTALWKPLKEKYSMAAAYNQAYARLAALQGCTPEQCINFCRACAAFLQLNDILPGALQFYWRLLRLYRQTYGENSVQTAEAYAGIGGVYGAMSQYKKAADYCRKSLALQQTLLPAHHPSNIENLNQLADFYTHTGLHKKALAYNLQALEICRATFGENHLKTAQTYIQIAWDYEYASQSAKALEALYKAEKILQRLYGEHHPQTAGCSNVLAWVCDSLGAYQKLLHYARKAHDICKTVYGERHSETGMSHKQLALACYRNGDYTQALEHNRRALEIFQAVYGEKHARVSIQYFQIGMYQLKLGQYIQAKENIEKSIELDIEALGTDAGDLAINYYYLGHALCRIGSYKQGVQTIEKGLALALREYGENSVDAAQARLFLGQAYCALGRFEEGLESLRHSLALGEKLYPAGHPELGVFCRALGLGLVQAGEQAAGEGYLARAEQIFLQAGTLHLAQEV